MCLDLPEFSVSCLCPFPFPNLSPLSPFYFCVLSFLFWGDPVKLSGYTYILDLSHTREREAYESTGIWKLQGQLGTCCPGPCSSYMLADRIGLSLKNNRDFTQSYGKANARQWQEGRRRELHGGGLWRAKHGQWGAGYSWVKSIWGNLPLLLWEEMPQNTWSTLSHSYKIDRKACNLWVPKEKYPWACSTVEGMSNSPEASASPTVQSYTLRARELSSVERSQAQRRVMRSKEEALETKNRTLGEEECFGGVEELHG